LISNAATYLFWLYFEVKTFWKAWKKFVAQTNMKPTALSVIESYPATTAPETIKHVQKISLLSGN